MTSITCPECHRTSYNPNDVREGYCGYCHWWTSDPQLGPHFAAVVAQSEVAATAMQATPGPVRRAMTEIFRAFRD